MRIAIIDLGTNTFNLLIADVVDQTTYNILIENKYAAKLGKGGINNKLITDEAFSRGITALEIHLETIHQYKVEKVVCIATSAIRNAANGPDFVEFVKRKLDLDIKVIDGLKEAQLIFDGIKQVVPLTDEKVMILDIGGGSNEFIIANKEGVFWKHSFELGMARMLDKFNPSNPITTAEIIEIETYFKQELKLLFDTLNEHHVETLVGSSGSFDTIAAMLAAIHHPTLDMTKISSYQIHMDAFQALHQTYLKSTFEERSLMKRMDPHRVDMIVLASIFINFIINHCGIKSVVQCTFSLKEGAIYQLINDQF